ncbi:hypothetical protein WUBG_16438 [Wuchereria bancrofti]|uniref:Uncharacterized protein n=1 Tax=Wuchereria bancrofti TaxID=6293 RepID=J9EB93_WUCBA|nr:hypothetical protein WUBG_16438 [Wuchereria bancrofti]
MWPGLGALFQFTHFTKSGQESLSLIAKFTDVNPALFCIEHGKKELKSLKTIWRKALLMLTCLISGNFLELSKQTGREREEREGTKREGLEGGLDVHFNNGTHPAFLRNVTATGNNHVCVRLYCTCVFCIWMLRRRVFFRDDKKLIVP